ncbi:MAG: hypothetical protein M1401_07935 [Chloroflexi bacterium]|nr:hypothetical protein [Chloroflexota bacterium]
MAGPRRQSAGDLLYVCLLSVALSGSLLPSLPLLAHRLGAAAPEVGLLVSAPILIFLFLPGGDAWAHLPRVWRRLLPPTLLAASLLTTAWATVPWQVLLLRAATGAACLGLTGLPLPRWPQMQAERSAAVAFVAWAVGPLVAGLATETAGLGGAFVLAAGLAALAVVPGVLRPEADDGPAGGPPPAPSLWGELPTQLAGLVLATFLPLYAADSGLTPGPTGALCTFAVLVGGAATVVARRWLAYAVTLATGGTLLAAVGTAALAVSAHLAIFAVGSVAFGLGLGCLAAGTAGGAGGSRRVRSTRPWLISLALLPPLAGVVVLALGAEALFLLLAAGLAVAALGLATTTTAARGYAQPSGGASGYELNQLSAASWDDEPAAGASLPEAPRSPRA